MIRICLLSLCLVLAACGDPLKDHQGTVEYTRLDDCRFVLEPGGNSGEFVPFTVIKDTPVCLHPEKLCGQPAGHGMSYPECEPPRADRFRGPDGRSCKIARAGNATIPDCRP